MAYRRDTPQRLNRCSSREVGLVSNPDEAGGVSHPWACEARCGASHAHGRTLWRGQGSLEFEGGDSRGPCRVLVVHAREPEHAIRIDIREGAGAAAVEPRESCRAECCNPVSADPPTIPVFTGCQDAFNSQCWRRTPAIGCGRPCQGCRHLPSLLACRRRGRPRPKVGRPRPRPDDQGPGRERQRRRGGRGGQRGHPAPDRQRRGLHRGSQRRHLEDREYDGREPDLGAPDRCARVAVDRGAGVRPDGRHPQDARGRGGPVQQPRRAGGPDGTPPDDRRRQMGSARRRG